MASDSEIRQWLRDHGDTRVTDRGPLSAARRNRYAAAHGETAGPGPLAPRLPTPGEADDLPPEVFGTVEPDDPPERETPEAAPPTPLGGAADPPGDDEPPGHTRPGWKDGPKRGSRPKAKLPRITVAMRSDIEAKLSFALEIPGRVWQARDPVCGSVFIEQRPEIAAALTEIVCQSPELIAFFAGGGGQFMLALNLMATLWPVVTVVMAHHVYHSIEAAPGADGQPDYQQYAA